MMIPVPSLFLNQKNNHQPNPTFNPMKPVWVLPTRSGFWAVRNWACRRWLRWTHFGITRRASMGCMSGWKPWFVCRLRWFGLWFLDFVYRLGILLRDWLLKDGRISRIRCPGGDAGLCGSPEFVLAVFFLLLGNLLFFFFLGNDFEFFKLQAWVLTERIMEELVRIWWCG